MSDNFIPKHGGYRNLLTYQKSEIIYDGTVYFTKRFLSKSDRTYDQMIQAARSGKQNIAEGSMASATSKETEIKLTNVAKASLEELKIDYEDFCRKNNYKIWSNDNKHYLKFKELNKTSNATYETFKNAIENPNPEICANSLIYLISITNYLLKKQIEQQQKDFLQNGGIRERMSKARLNHKNNTNNNNNNFF
jgi:four helix bundle suffix protein